MPDPSPLSLSVGDRVVYPNQGVCRVTAVEVKEVAGQKLTFVSIKRESDGALVMVPQAKVATIGVRKVASQAEVDGIFDFLRSDSDKADLDWKQRARTNLDRMSTGGILGLAEVVKGLQVLSELRPLPTKERELYDNARHLLTAEISASLNISECDAEDSVDLVLFPPGRERPKRTAEEFRAPGGEGEDGDDLGLSDELLALGGELDLPSEEEPAPAEEETTAPADGADADEAEPTAGKKKGRKAAAEDEDAEDDETTETATAVRAAPDDGGEEPKRKRGRPPKPKPPVDPNAPPPEPKKRGRPPKSAAEKKK